MFIDANVAWDKRRAGGLAVSAARLGYSAVVHNVTLIGPTVADLRNHSCPIALPVLADVPTSKNGPFRASLPRVLGLGHQTPPGGLTQLKRLTITVSDGAQALVACSAAAQQAAYDIIAVRPTTAEAWFAISEKCDCDIISFPLDDRMNFTLRRKEIDAVLARGCVFEVEFAPSLRDLAKRRATLTNMELLCHHTRGRQILVSSGAADALELRSPHDLANFGRIFGLKGALGLESLSKIPLHALQHRRLRRSQGTSVVAEDPTGPDLRMNLLGGGGLGRSNSQKAGTEPAVVAPKRGRSVEVAKKEDEDEEMGDAFA